MQYGYRVELNIISQLKAHFQVPLPLLRTSSWFISYFTLQHLPYESLTPAAFLLPPLLYALLLLQPTQYVRISLVVTASD